jgi:hypothetical protein
VDEIYSQTLAEFNKVITEKDFESLLFLYNRKSLPLQVSGALGLKNGELPELIVRLAQQGKYREQIVIAMKKYFGNFAQYI